MLDRFTGGEEGKAYFKTVVPLKHIGQSEEIARAITFIASESVSFITGQILTVDGGKTAG